MLYFTENTECFRVAAASLHLCVTHSFVFQTVEELLVAILKHPTLETWFLALEQKALPPHTLSPVLVKLLAAHFSAGVLQLLVASSPILHKLGQLGLLAKYSEAITQSVLRELRTRTVNSATTPKTLPQLEALRELHPYMEGVQIREVTLALLGLPEAHLLTQQGTQCPGKERQLSSLGKTLVQLLASSHQNRLQSSELLWCAEYVRGLGALLPTLAEQELDTVFLQTLQKDPVLAPVVPTDLLEYCLVRRTKAALGIASLLLQYSSTHLLKFELWCGQPGVGPSLQEHLDDFFPLIHVYLQHRMQGSFMRPTEGMGIAGFGQLTSSHLERQNSCHLKPCHSRVGTLQSCSSSSLESL